MRAGSLMFDFFIKELISLIENLMFIIVYSIDIMDSHRFHEIEINFEYIFGGMNVHIVI